MTGRRVLVVLATVVAAVAVAGPAGAVTGSWTVMPAQPFVNAFDLNAVDSVSTSSGLAVGTVFNQGEHGFALRFDGANWGNVAVPQTNPDVQLTGAVLTSGTDGWAVGAGSEFGGFYSGTRPVALHWNGSSLTAAGPSLTVKSKFTAVSALSSSSVWAVGRIGNNSLVERWNGSAWSQVTVPDPNPANPSTVDSLSAVSARTSTDIWAVGGYSAGPFALHFDGTSWQVVAVPVPSGTSSTTLRGVVAVGASDVWAVGDTFTTAGAEVAVIEHWTGTAWHLVSAPSGLTSVTLTGVAARSGTDVWAVGSAATTTDDTIRTLSLQWNGTAWTRLPSPPSGSGNLHGVSTRPGASRVLACGTDSNGFGFVMTHP